MPDQVYKGPRELAESFKEEEKENPSETQEEKMEEGKKDWKQVVADLIKDEEEAIAAYNGAIEFINDLGDDVPQEVKENYLKVLEEIKKDEEDHIKKLEVIKGEEKDADSI